MFKIGDFSKLSQVSSKTLRYYDDIGLLKPIQVDQFTGYRYYSVEQLPRLNRVVALKELGFSLNQISDLLEKDVSAEQIQGMLRMKQAEIEQHIEAENQRLLQVRARLQKIQNEDTQAIYDVVTKKPGKIQVASIREHIPHYGHMGHLMSALLQELKQQNIAFNGSPIALYHDGDYQEQNPDVEVCFTVEGVGQDTERVCFKELPNVAVATTLHTGPYETLSFAYMALLQWVNASDYELSQPNREIYLRGPGRNRTPEDYITEIQFPILKRTE